MNVSIEINPRSKLLGRIEHEIEIFAHYVLGCSPEELTTWIGTALVVAGANSRFNVEEVSNLRGKTPKAHQRLREVALRSSTRDGKTSEPQSKPRKVKHPMSEAVKERLRKTAKARWAKMSERQRTLLLNKMLKARKEKAKLR